MIENLLLKSNFLGKDGFRWWIGQIPPRETWLLQWSKKPKAWGNRVRVRIMGYHPPNTTELADKDLPWATVLMPATAGSGKGGDKNKVKVKPGDVVIGFFLDGEDAQQPVIFGVFGNSEYVVNKEPPLPFVPFTGYTPETEPGGKVIIKEESNGGTPPKERTVMVEKERAKELTDQTGVEYRSVSDAVGSCVALAGTDAQTEIQTNLKNATKEFKNATGAQKNKLISNLTKKIGGISNSFTGDLTKSALTSLAPKLNSGLDVLYGDVFSKIVAATKNTAIAKKAGTAAQAAMLGPVSALQKKAPCVMDAIGNTMLPDIRSLLTSFMDNVENPTSCMSEQFTGAIFNKIISGIGDELSSELGGVGKILGGFDMISDLRGKAEGLLGIQEAIKCVAPGTANVKSSIWCLGKGPMNMPGITGEAIMSAANAAQSLQEAAGAPGGILGQLGGFGQFDFMNSDVSDPNYTGECKASPPTDCKGMQVKIFGADGEGALAEPIVGALVGDAFAQQTGSLIGIKLTNPGQGYTIPPLVEITDNCDKGYGASARAVIDYDPQSPTYQQVIDIYVVTPGENYPVIEENSKDKEYTVDHVAVISPGEGYIAEDKITDNVGNEYVKFLDEDGRILNVIPPNAKISNVKAVQDIPKLFIESRTGFGAIIKAQITPRPSYQGETKQVIDCITPRNNLVGYVNGEPYYGAFHVHPTRGVKMVGAAHTTTAHAIIYDTPAESRAAVVDIPSSTSTIIRNVSQGATTPSTSETSTPTSSPSYSPPSGASSSPSSPPSAPSSPPSNPPSNPPSSPPSGGGYPY